MGEKKQLIAVGMSGGVDSSMAAALLLEEGHEVVGYTLLLKEKALRCVSELDAERARKVADHLGIEHRVVDAKDAFEETIIRYFVDTYAAGRTPSPCVLCNPMIKFGHLLEVVRQAGCDALATGHYARTVRKDQWHLVRGVDRKKDQSYFLHRLSQDQLSAARFPLGEWKKEDVRKACRERGLPVVHHAESQDLCFVDQDNYADLVELYRPEVIRRGRIVSDTGKTLAEHSGAHRFTVGQRKGLGIATGEPMYVKELSAERNEVVVAPRPKAMRKTCTAEDVCWIADEPPSAQFKCAVRVRYRHTAAPATVTADGKRMKIVFDEEQFAITPGQAAVCYDEDEVLGGGWIV